MKKSNIIFFIIFGVIFWTIFFSWGHKNFSGTQSGILPNPQLTPGVINPAVTQSNIQSTICKSGWTATIRPPSSYTSDLKTQQLNGWSGQKIMYATAGQYVSNQVVKLADYEEDHLISLELGGHPTDPNNLWPESYLTTPNARDKDQVENYLKRQVCAGKITLAEAQKEISTDWTKVNIGKTPIIFGSTEIVDEDDI